MRVVVYVEGPSDKAALTALLAPVIELKRTEGVEIAFFEAPEGDRKVSVLSKVPRRAANILLNSRDTIVAAIPDLYPRNKAFPHETAAELIEGIHRIFVEALKSKGVDDDRIEARFKVFCFKHDMESLVLAAEEQLQSRLGISRLIRTWQIPVENQDQDHPPKVIVSELFQQCGLRYVETIDAPLILGNASYADIALKCPQHFQPFVNFLQAVTNEVTD